MGVFDKTHQVDHINGDTLDNRESNLRVVTALENGQNKRKRKSASSKYKGVKWHKRDNIWESLIMHKGKSYYLGRFKEEKDAGLAYNKKSIELHGEFGFINDIK